MAWAFGTYLMIKGVKKIVKVDFLEATLIGLAAAAVVFFVMRTLVGRRRHTRQLMRFRARSRHPLLSASSYRGITDGVRRVGREEMQRRRSMTSIAIPAGREPLT